MGTAPCKTRSTNETEIHRSCICASRGLSTDYDQESLARGGAFVTNERAEHAEIARLIEALARPATRSALPEIVTDDPPIITRCWDGQFQTKHGVLSERHAGEESRVLPQRRSPGLSVFDLTTSSRTAFKSCSADKFFELISADEEELPETPNSSLAFNRVCACRSKARDAKPGIVDDAASHEHLRCSTSVLAMSFPKVLGANVCASSSASTEWDDASFESDREASLHQNFRTILTLPQHILSESSARNCVNGSLCVGQWNNDLLDGYGIERWPDGTVFIGDFSNGRKHGDGRLVLASGSSYEGEFQDDANHGEGLYLWSDGRGYSGQWVQGDVGPYGTMRWSDGRTYQGDWHDGHMHGFGKFQWPDGRHFAGQWVSGRQHGVGVVRSVLGHERQSLWKDGEFARWLSAPCEGEGGAGDDLVGDWEVSVGTPRPSPRPLRQTPRSSPERGLTPRWSPRSPACVGEASLVIDECLPLDVESCTLGLCKANGARNIEL